MYTNDVDRFFDGMAERILALDFIDTIRVRLRSMYMYIELLKYINLLRSRLTNIIP